MEYLYWVLGLLAIGGTFGVIMLRHALRNVKPPRWAVVGHGIANTVALIFVIIAVADMVNGPKTALILLVITALGGAYLLSRDLANKAFPRAMLYLHPTLAVISIIALILFIANNGDDGGLGTGMDDGGTGTGTGTGD